MSALGIDPGLDGALALLIDGFDLEVYDMPTLKVGKGRIVDALAIARWLDERSAILGDVWLEHASARPNNGTVQAFKLGENYGILKGALAANFLRIHIVHPAKWKREMRVTSDKDSSRARASGLFPRQSGLFARKKDDGRAEAVLIALYGARIEAAGPA